MLNEGNEFVKQETVHSLAQAVRRGGHTLGSVPGLLRRIIEDDMWSQRHFGEQSIEVRDFREFVEREYPEGLGTTIETLEALCKYDPDLMDYLAAAKRGKVGRPPKSDTPREHTVDARGNVVKIHDNIMNNTKPIQQGTSAEYAYNKLRDEAYNDDGSVKNKRVATIHKRVISGEITPHAGMVEAGFRVQRRAVNMDSPESTAATIRKYMSDEDIRELIRLLVEGA